MYNPDEFPDLPKSNSVKKRSSSKSLTPPKNCKSLKTEMPKCDCESKFESLLNEIRTLAVEVANLTSTLGIQNCAFQRLETTIQNLTDENKKLKEEITEIRQITKEQRNMIDQLHHDQAVEEYNNIFQDQLLRKKKIRLYKIPYFTGEVPVDLARQFLSSVLPNVGLEIKKAYRTGRDSKFPIVVQFKTSENAQLVLTSARNLHSENGGRIRRDMSKRHLDLRQRLYGRAADLNKNNIKYIIKSDCIFYDDQDWFISSSGWHLPLSDPNRSSNRRKRTNVGDRYHGNTEARMTTRGGNGSRVENTINFNSQLNDSM